MFLVMMSRTFEFRISTAGRKELAELASRRRGNQEPALVRECATSRPKKDAQSGSAGKTSSDAVLRLGHNKEPRRSGARAYSGPFRGCRGAKTVPLALYAIVRIGGTVMGITICAICDRRGAQPSGHFTARMSACAAFQYFPRHHQLSIARV